ncbi:oligosaccharide flippase family protein [Lutibacter sp.]|uniref:oligosaccharide flippase family protein n=1 Tax=Lutibacter sp. TaxID=1925666 RepID=UPI001A2B3A6C|nr:oligosaccharide flippase family protein [Lutibacter sp.]MBI9041546.1 oligosaccharide flippase family protein [Lutibacter sp.]
MSQLKKGALLSYFTIFLTNIIGLVLTPFIIRSIGDAEYGLYTLIGAFVGYISVLDFGLNNTIIRFVAKYRAEKDKKGEENFLAITMLIYVVISVVIAIIGIILYFNLDVLFSNSLTLDEIAKAKVMFIILIFNLVITLPGGAFTAICSGYEHFVFPRTINIIRYIVRSVLVVGLLLYGGDAIGLVVLDTIMNVLVIVFNGYYVFKKLKVTFKLYEFQLPLVKEIFSYSVWIFIYALVYKMQWNAGQVVLGMNTDTVTVAIYAVGIMLGGYYGAFAGAINGLLVPKATQMSVQKRSGTEYTNEMIKIGRLNSFLLFFILNGFILFGKDFINLWLGESYINSWYIALCIMIVMSLPLIQAFGNSILEAKKKNRFKSVLSLTTVALGVFIGFYFSKIYGVFGVILPLVLAMGFNSLIMIFYYKKIFGLKIRQFFINTLGKIFLITSVLGIISYFIIIYFPILNWFDLFLQIFIYSLAYSLVVYFVVLNKFEKSLILTK